MHVHDVEEVVLAGGICVLLDLRVVSLEITHVVAAQTAEHYRSIGISPLGAAVARTQESSVLGGLRARLPEGGYVGFVPHLVAGHASLITRDHVFHEVRPVADLGGPPRRVPDSVKELGNGALKIRMNPVRGPGE
jgi:hypothetical protein